MAYGWQYQVIIQRTFNCKYRRLKWSWHSLDCFTFGQQNLPQNNFRPYDKIMIEKLNDYDLKIKFYPGRIQFKNSNLCGYFSIMIAKYLKKYEPDEPFKIINELFGLKPDNNDIKQLIKHFGVLKTNT